MSDANAESFPDKRFTPFSVCRNPRFPVPGEALVAESDAKLQNHLDVLGCMLFQSRDDILDTFQALTDDASYRAKLGTVKAKEFDAFSKLTAADRGTAMSVVELALNRLINEVADMGYFANCLTNAEVLPECGVDVQYFADMRSYPKELLTGVAAIVHLAAISNDPMGNTFEEVTYDINFRSSIELAKKAKEAGVKRFVFASSWSMYGFADDAPRTETSPLNPLTAYAKSKVSTEKDLEKIADKKFIVTSLRFATACGMSERLRLDLVLNDFVAGAVASKKITILSDGTPWRPLINIIDMARAI